MSGMEALAEKWLKQCGSCDGGLPMGCTHPTEDYRPVIADLLDRVGAAEAAVAHWKRTCVTWSEEYALIWKVGRDSRDTGRTFLADSVLEFTAEIRAALDTPVVVMAVVYPIQVEGDA